MSKKTVFKFADAEPASDAGELEERIAGLDVGEGEEVPNSILNRVIALKEEHAKFAAIDEAYKAERVILEKKYFEQKQDIYSRRAEIVSGGVEVEAKVPVEPDDDTNNVPGFWAAAICNHGTVGQLVTEEDMPALEALTDIKVEYNDKWSGFTLTFVFAENKFFNNAELKKTYEVSPDLLDDKAPELNTVEGTPIVWKTGCNLCVTETKKKQKAKSGRNAGQVRVVTKTQPKPSFFHFFSDPKMDEADEEEEEEEDNEKEDFTLHVDEDYEIAHAFRTEIIPEALLWYTGEAVGDGYDEEDDEEEGDDDDEEGEDDDEPDHESHEVGGSAAGGFTAPAAGDAPAPECKQS